MTVDVPASPPMEGRPLPLPDTVSGTYWRAAAGGELLYQECPACGHRQLYPRALCVRCAAEPAWQRSAGRGRVHTFTVIHQNWAPPFRDLVPYVVAIVELDEGPRMMSNVTHCDPARVYIGMPVELYTVAVEDGIGIPFWRPAAEAEAVTERSEVQRHGRLSPRSGDTVTPSTRRVHQ